MSSKNKELLLYFSRHKAASTWMNRILRNITLEMGLNYQHRNNKFINEEFIKKIIADNKIFGIDDPDINIIRTIKDFKGFHIIRDPRDIVVSAYFSHCYTHPTNNWPELIEMRKKLQKMTKDEGLFFEIDFLKKVFKKMYEWDYNMANVKEFKYEELINDPVKFVLEIIDFLGILENDQNGQKRKMISLIVMINKLKKRRLCPFSITLNKLPANRIINIVERNSFSKINEGRHRGDEDIKSRYRKGIAGDWKNYFKTAHKDYFKKKYNDMLVKLAYEKDINW